MLDEASNSRKQTILNVLVGVLDSQKYMKPRVILSKEVKQTDAMALYNEVKTVIAPLEASNYNKNSIRAGITDGASNVKSLGKIIKQNHPGALHVVCFCHNIHNLVQSIAEDCFLVTSIISIITGSLRIGYKNQEIWEATVGSSRMPDYIKTRFGLWLRSATFIVDNFEGIKNFLFSLDKTWEEKVNYTMADPLLYKQLKTAAHFRNLPGIITFLETNGLTLSEQLDTYELVVKMVSTTHYKARFAEIQGKNKDMPLLFSMASRRVSMEKSIFKYLPLTTMEVERSFSLYRRIFTDKRASLKDTKVEAIYHLSHRDGKENK